VVRVVISNRPEAGGLAFSRQWGIPTLVFPRSDFPSREAQQGAMADALLEHQVELVVLAGCDQVLNADPRFSDSGPFRNRMINIHPSLLPAFAGGLHAVRDALAWGVKVTGVTVHIANDELDAGPIILQEAVCVDEDDTEDSLRARIQEVEHRLFPAAIQLFAQGRLKIEGRRVHILP
jgi:phosphoribosylglycinamide formyltransferase-1